jgi:hypothetical protein
VPVDFIKFGRVHARCSPATCAATSGCSRS